MTPENRARLNDALTTAAEMIRSHSEVGIDEYAKACIRASKLIETIARKYEPK